MVLVRMEDDLERAGWQAGQEKCPLCGQVDILMELHWGVHHGGIERSIAKLSGNKYSSYFTFLSQSVLEL